MAIQYLSYKNELKKKLDYLKKNDINEMAVEKVIEYCYKEQYINHEDYAESLKNTMIQQIKDLKYLNKTIPSWSRT